MYSLLVEDKVIDKWLPVIEGQKNWADFVSACPKVEQKDIAPLAQMMENVESFCEQTVSADGTADYSPILIPMLRRTMPALIGPRLFGYQPMTGPTGLVIIMRKLLQNTQDAPVTYTNSVVLTLADATNFTVGGSCSITADAAVGTVMHKEGNNILVKVTSGTFVASADIDNTASFVAAETTISAVYTNEAMFNIIFSNYSGTYATSVAEQLSTDMKEVGIRLEKQAIEAKSRKLKARWTTEFARDIKALHNVDAEQILSGVASDEIIMEMNAEFMAKIRTLSTNTSAYDYTTTDADWELRKLQNLMTKITRAKRQVAQVSKASQANYMIVSSDVLSILESTGRLTDENLDPVNQVYAGKALGMDVYVDLYASNDDIYMGVKNANQMQAGVFYCPYVPLTIEKGFDANSGQPISIFSTRYALMENPWGASNYFHRLTVANLPA